MNRRRERPVMVWHCAGSTRRISLSQNLSSRRKQTHRSTFTFSLAMSTNLSTYRPVSSWSVAAFRVQRTALLGSFAGNIPFPFIDSLQYAPHCSFPPAIWVRWSLFFCLYQNCGAMRLSLYSVPLRNEGKKMSCILMLIQLIWRTLSFPRAGSLTMDYDYSLQFGTVSCDSHPFSL
jgi:uncharacterized protein YfiM (DUF2279 family)